MRQRRKVERRLAALTAILLMAPLGIVGLATDGGAAPEPGSVLIPCPVDDKLVKVTVTSHLDPTCTYTRGIQILASGVTLDCQGALIKDIADRRFGIEVVTPSDVPLSDITIRNCNIEGFLNNIRVTRDGFRDLAEGEEYDNTISNVLIEDSRLANSRGVGLFVDGYVTEVTIRRLHVSGTGSSGIYLEAGSRNSIVEDSTIVDNGFGENGPDGQLFEVGGETFRFWGTGREGISIDGSYGNVVRNNVFEGNSAGAIFLYKNCGEFVNERPGRWFERRYGADDNLIESNTIIGGENGVWIGARMAENLLPMDCSDPAYIDESLQRAHLDYADANIVRGNSFEGVIYAIRVEDDHNQIEANTFTSDDPAHQAVLFGTKLRTEVLGQPVTGTTIVGNTATIAGNTHPYRWIHGHTATTFDENLSLGVEVGVCEGVQPPINPFVFVLAFAPEDPEGPVTPRPDIDRPDPVPLPSCPADSIDTGTGTGAGLSSTSSSSSAAVVGPRFTG